MAKRKASLAARVRKAWREAVEFWLDFASFCYTSILESLHKATLPVTSRLLSRKPRPPHVSVKDIRAKRIRLAIDSDLSSPFNVEEFEVQWRPRGDDEWQSAGKSDLTQRTVARLAPDAPYQFRVCAHNRRGVSGWSKVVEASTKIDPVDGGGRGPDDKFTWTQSATDVTIMFKLSLGTTKHDVSLALRPERLSVHARGAALLEGDLYGMVRGWDDGSTWTLSREKDHTLLTVTLEKHVKSLAPKFDYWRCIVAGQPEIDTHQLVSEASGAQMLQPGNMDPQQLHSMGLGQFAKAYQ